MFVEFVETLSSKVNQYTSFKMYFTHGRLEHLAGYEGNGMVSMLYRALNDVERVQCGQEQIFMLREHDYVVTFDLKINSSWCQSKV